MTDEATLLAGLNAQQRTAVEAVEGPVLVLAGPGSGKTRVLTHRVAYLIDVVGIPPWNLMAVTFTNKAAREMRSRLGELIGDAALGRLTIGTFHAICARLLRRHGETLPFDRSFVIFDTADQRRAVKQALDALNLDPKQYRPRAVLGAISNAKNELIRPQDYAAPTYWHEVAGRVYTVYQEILRKSNALDFDDLLLETAMLVRENHTVREALRERFPFVLVDEFQDTNSAQYALVRTLAAAEVSDAPHNLFVVGDEDQSIYRWRGADYRNLERFRRDFPETRTVLLEQNYRSTGVILDAAQSVIDRNTHRTPKALWTEAGRGAPLTLFEAYDETEEAAYVAREIERLVERGARYGDIAVTYRTNAQSRALEDVLVRRGVPYQLVGGTRFYERREVKDVLAYLRLVHNPLDEVSLERVINTPSRGIGAGTLELLSTLSERTGVPRWPTLKALAAGELDDVPGLPTPSTRARNALLGFHALLSGLIADREDLTLPELVDAVLERTGYEDTLRDGSDEGEERWENVLELRGVAVDYEALAPREALATFLEAVALVSDVDRMEEAPDRVTLLTLHSAKGLEFPTVFITGLEENFLPHSRAADEPEELAEERRLFYVGITRAEERVYLVHCFRRTVWGSDEVRDRSRFIDDIPEELLERAGATPTRQARPSGRRARTTWAPAERVDATPGATAESAPETVQFGPGDKVRHEKFGTGVVVSSRLLDADEEVTVAFADVGVKKLLQSFAGLEKAGG